MKKLYTILFVLGSYQMAFAQFGVTLAYQFGVAGKDLYSSDMKNSLLGLNAKLNYTYDDYLKLNIGTGYYLIPFDKIAVDGVQKTATGVNLSVIPITVGAEFTFLDQRPEAKQKVKPYIGLDIGWAITKRNKSDLAPAQTQNNIIIAPSLGIAYGLSDNLDLNLCIRDNFLIYSYRDQVKYYEIYSLLGFNLGVSYRF